MPIIVGMSNTTTRLATHANQRPVFIEQMEGRLLMSGDSTGVDLGRPVLTTQTQSTTMLLPAVQAAREAARHSLVDGTSNTVMF